MFQRRTFLLTAAGLSALALGLACGGSSKTLDVPAVATGTVGFMTTDATSESWSNVGIIIRKAKLVLASDLSASNPVTIYDGSNDNTPVNLLQEDQINDLLSQATGVPAGVYDRLIVEVDGAPGSVTLVGPADAGGTLPSPIPANQILIRGKAAGDGNGWIALPTITLATPVTVSAGSASAVAVDFDLSHPAFIVEHDLNSGSVLYVVNFSTKGVFRHKHAASLDHYYLRRHLGTVASVAADGSSFTMTTEHGQSLTILADKTTGSLFYDRQSSAPRTPATATSIPGNLIAGDAVECTARFQAGGSLTAVRVWYTTGAVSTLPAWTPEGHVTKVDAANGIMYVLDSQDNAQAIKVNASTRWFFHGDHSTDISAGAGAPFLANVDRYFKVHVMADPLASPLTAATVDIQRAVFEGRITQAPPATASGFTYFKTYADLATSTRALGYASGFSFWDFTFPGAAGTDIPTFLAEANSGVTLDNSGSQFMPYGISSLAWNAGTPGWDANNVVFMPIRISALAQTVQSVSLDAAGNGSFVVLAKDAGAVPVTVTLNATAQEQPIVTLFARTGTVVTVSNLEPAAWAANLGASTRVRVYGVPSGGNIKAYYVNIYQ